ncbi:protein of unknown function [Serratia sp. Tan611]|nr:protein of unknown function [Serratia sp. Tan611]
MDGENRPGVCQLIPDWRELFLEWVMQVIETGGLYAAFNAKLYQYRLNGSLPANVSWVIEFH